MMTMAPRSVSYTHLALTSAYATGRFRLADPLSMILGARLDWFDFDNKQYQGAWSSHRKFSEDKHFTPYAALTYDPVSYTHLDVYKRQ